MANKVAIVTDSLACLTRELVEEYEIGVVPLNIHFEGKVYKDWVDITPSQSYELFLKNPDSWGSSAPSPEDFLKAYREASKQTKNILCITISAKLSATYDIAQVAKERAEVELPGTAIEVLDSQTTTAAEGFVALAAARAAAEMENLAEVIKAAEEMRDKVRFFAFLDTVRHVYRSGRIPKIASQVGSILHIKPILTTSSGLVHFAGVARSKKSGVERLLKIMRNKVGLRVVHVAVMHAYAQDEGERLKERISSEFNCAELWITEFSPVMGYACGTGTLGIAFYLED
ncbi:DegV domain-containing protein [subsurface metagenome]